MYKALSLLVVPTVSCFKANALVIAFDNDLFISAVLSTLPSAIIYFVIPVAVPVKVGLASVAYEVKVEVKLPVVT